MSQYVGILEEEGRGGLVRAKGQPDMEAIHIAAADLKGAPYGMMVAVELINDSSAEVLRGKIAEVLGDPYRPDVAMESIIRQHGLSETFPKEVVAEAETMPAALAPELIEHELALGRRDLRDLKTMTIDGLDARDLDDAISVRAEEDGRVRLWVHIADVSYYVKEGSPLDREAYKRGTSVYLADRVLPMLPPQLSNGICSLNPSQDRFAMTCEMLFDREGSQIDGDIYESLIRSDLRANYEDVRKSLEGEIAEGYEDFMPELQVMEKLAKILSDLADKRGALDFEFPETKVEIDADGKVTGIHPYPTSFANEIIEQFMISANRYVAKTFTDLALPFLYRVHDWPDPDKLEQVRQILRMQGGKIRLSAKPKPTEMAAALKDLSQMPGSQALQNLLLRSLAKAIYSAQPLGHYGLALHDYTHFTSPIRRYPDLFIHRVIRGYLRDEMKLKRWRSIAPEVADQTSLCERVSIEAERDSVDQKVVEYYAEHLGEVYEGQVTGFVPSGMFVMLPSSAEGMIPFRNMMDYYYYDEVLMQARGRAFGGLFRLGDRFEVRIARADVVNRQLDLALVDEVAAGKKNAELAKALGPSKGGGRDGRKAEKSKAKKRRHKSSLKTKKRKGKRR